MPRVRVSTTARASVWRAATCASVWRALSVMALFLIMSLKFDNEHIVDFYLETYDVLFVKCGHSIHLPSERHYCKVVLLCVS